MKNLVEKLLALMLFGVILASCKTEPSPRDNTLNFNLIFQDAQGIAVGNHLVFQGVTIGSVTDVTLMRTQTTDTDAPCNLDPTTIEQLSTVQVACVSIAVGAENRDLVRTDSDFIIRRSALVSVTDQKHIEITVWENTSPEMPEGATIVGIENVIDLSWERLKRMGERGLTLGDLAIRTELGQDETVTRTYMLETSPYLPTEMLLEGLLPQDVGWQVTHPQETESNILLSSRSFPSVRSLVDTDTRSNISFETKKSLLGISTDYVYTETFQAGQFAVDYERRSLDEWQTGIADWFDRLIEGREDQISILGEIRSTIVEQIRALITPLNRVVAIVTVEMPGEIVKSESNAHFVIGNQASWIVSVQDLNNGFVANAVARQNSLSSGGSRTTSFIVVVVIIVLGIVLAIAVYTRYKVKRADAAAVGSFDEFDEIF